MIRPLATAYQLLPLYHPTSILLVDGNADFLRSMMSTLEATFSCLAFHTAQDAIAYIRSERRLLEHPRMTADATPLGTMEHIRDLDQRLMHLRASRLPRVFSDEGRFGMTSVIVADLSMSGLAMLEAVRDTPLRKIMLSGIADTALAESALQNGLIDAFCAKQDPSLYDSLTRQLRRLQFDYFRGLTHSIQPALTRADTRFLDDQVVQDAFLDFVADNNIIEYCACMYPPGILGLDEEGNPAIMLVVDGDYLQASFEIAHAERAPTELLRTLIRNDAIPVFPTHSGFYASGLEIDWRDCVWQSRQLGASGWQSAIIDEPAIARMVCGPIAPYARYRNRRLN